MRRGAVISGFGSDQNTNAVCGQGRGRPRIYLPCSRHIFLSPAMPARKMIFCNTDEECGWRNCPAVKRRPQNFSTPINRHPSIPHFCWGRQSNAATQRGGTTQPRPRNTWRYLLQVAAGVACALSGKNKIIWQSVLFAPPERLDGVYGPAAPPRKKRFRRSHCSRKGINHVYLLHFSKH